MKGNLIIGLLVTCAYLEIGCSGAIKLKNKNVNDIPDPVRDEPPEEKDDSIGAFQSDMLLSPEQMAEVMERIHEEQTGTYKRRAHSNLSYRWPQNIVPFEFDTSSEADRSLIQAGMDLWTNHTCIQFVPYSVEVGQTLGHENRVKFIRGKGCYSYVGMVRLGEQTISIGTGCGGRGTVAHEIGHAIGWHHEQSRPDRDDYVTINYANVKSGRDYNFYKYATSSIATHDVPYDTGSVMHYGALYFSSNGLPTIVAVDPMDQYKLGNRNNFSFYDIKMANLMLECASHCPTETHLQCQNEGFIGKDCTCLCKPGYIGDVCQTFDEGSAECFYELSDQSGTLNSPNFPEPYGNYELCVWKIVGEEGSTVNLTFTAFDIERGQLCRFDRVAIRSDFNLTAASEQKFCGNAMPPEIESVGNQMLVVFYSDNSYVRPGFEAHYVIHGRDEILDIPSTVNPTTPTMEATTALGTPFNTGSNCESVVGTCGGAFNGTGCIASPNYGQGNYNLNEKCVYTIEVNMRLCGDSSGSESIVSTSNKLTVKLVSDGTVTKVGFVAKFEPINSN